MGRRKRLEWRDVSLSLGQKTSYRLEAGRLCISVTRHTSFAPDAWVLRCEPFFFLHELRSRNIARAMEEAVDLVRRAMTDSAAILAAGRPTLKTGFEDDACPNEMDDGQTVQ